MSAPSETPVRDAAPAICPRCGSPLRPDQDWCLSCGAAVTTHVTGAPGWRTPVAIVGAVLALAAVALVVAFLELSDDADRVAQAPEPTPTAAAPPPATATPAPSPTPSPVPGTTPTPSPTPGTTPAPGATPAPGPSPGGTTPNGTTSGTVGEWPAGRTAFTVILASETSRQSAERKAQDFSSQGTSVGILDSDDFKSLRGGYWVVFSGQYDTREQADSAADGLKARAPDAYVRRIEPR